MALARSRGDTEVVTVTDVEAALGTKALPYGRDAHYDIISAFIKSIRGSDIDAALSFYSDAFDWRGVQASEQTLRTPDGDVSLRRTIGQAGLLELELIEGQPDAADPYSSHLRRGDHGLVHAGFAAPDAPRRDTYEWVETGEAFDLRDWGGGRASLQMRHGGTLS